MSVTLSKDSKALRYSTAGKYSGNGEDYGEPLAIAVNVGAFGVSVRFERPTGKKLDGTVKTQKFEVLLSKQDTVAVFVALCRNQKDLVETMFDGMLQALK